MQDAGHTWLDRAERELNGIQSIDLGLSDSFPAPMLLP